MKNPTNREIDSVLIGIGNAWRTDDGLGPKVASYFLKEKPTDFDVQILSGEMSELLDLFSSYKKVYVVDAFRTGSLPGTIFNLNYLEIAQGSYFESSVSSHGMGLWKALEMAEVLGTLPPYLEVFGIEGESYENGTELSYAVQSKINELIELIMKKIKKES